jgi:hypothetical protein
MGLRPNDGEGREDNLPLGNVQYKRPLLESRAATPNFAPTEVPARDSECVARADFDACPPSENRRGNRRGKHLERALFPFLEPLRQVVRKVGALLEAL